MANCSNVTQDPKIPENMALISEVAHWWEWAYGHLAPVLRHPHTWCVWEQDTHGYGLGGAPHTREQHGSSTNITTTAACQPTPALISPDNEDEEVFHDYHRKEVMLLLYAIALVQIIRVKDSTMPPPGQQSSGACWALWFSRTTPKLSLATRHHYLR